MKLPSGTAIVADAGKAAVANSGKAAPPNADTPIVAKAEKAAIANASKAAAPRAARPIIPNTGKPVVGQQVWHIVGYSNSKQTSEEKISWRSADVAAIVAILRERISRHLTARDLQSARAGETNVLEPRHDADSQRRLTISMGESPLYVATLWRSDDVEGDGAG